MPALATNTAEASGRTVSAKEPLRSFVRDNSEARFDVKLSEAANSWIERAEPSGFVNEN
jgi:hypothetical protein